MSGGCQPIRNHEIKDFPLHPWTQSARISNLRHGLAVARMGTQGLANSGLNNAGSAGRLSVMIDNEAFEN